MGGFLSDVLGTKNSVNVNNSNPYDQLQPWQNRAGSLADQLQTQSAGGGPNPAQLQLLQNAQAISGQQAAQTAANRAINPALAARIASQNAATQGASAASNASIQQMQQQLASQQLLGGVIGQQEGATNTAGGINAGIAAGNQQSANLIVGGLLNGAGAAVGGGGKGKYKGGMIEGYDSGGSVQSPTKTGAALDAVGGSMSSGDPVALLRNFMLLSKSGGGLIPVMQAMGGKVPALLSPGEKYLDPKEAKNVAEGKESVKSAGKMVPGKANVPGDSKKNDTVPAKLEEGGIVIPRSEMDSEKDAKAFVAKHFRDTSSHQKDFKDALKRTIAGRKNKNAA